MNAPLTKSEKEVLTNHFRFSEWVSDRESVIQGTDLLDFEKMHSMLEEIQSRLQAPSKKVAASIFSKRYSYAVAVTGLFAMSAWNKALDLRPENIALGTNGTDSLWLPSLHLSDQTAREFSGSNRGSWLEEVVRSLFEENIDPVWNVLSEVSGLSKYVLWENTAIYIYWLYEKKMNESGFVIGSHDFSFLLHPDNGPLFGNYTKNPLLRYYGGPVSSGGEDTRFRKTCCLSFQLPGGGYCKTCPGLKNCGTDVAAN